jgi:hypothetical protein
VHAVVHKMSNNIECIRDSNTPLNTKHTSPVFDCSMHSLSLCCTVVLFPIAAVACLIVLYYRLSAVTTLTQLRVPTANALSSYHVKQRFRYGVYLLPHHTV